MKKLSLTILLALSACAPKPSTFTAAGLGIVGGAPVQLNEPLAHQVVAIVGQTQTAGFLCTGVLIAANKVLTAAHCAEDLHRGLIVFSTDLSTKSVLTRRPIISAAIQPKFEETMTLMEDTQKAKLKNWGDLAILTFQGSAPKDYAPVEIADSDDLGDGQNLIIAGYGLLDGHDQEPAARLNAASVQIKKANFSRSEFSIDQRNGKGACHGDSGGPAFAQSGSQYYLMGITSRGSDKYCERTGIYTRVSTYLNWIDQELERK